MGLGLSISHSIVEAHHGKLVVESAEGRGATFTIVLPAAAGAAHLR
ncbi:MAG TPA: ATP-binding protein [Myxococcales bacterium]